MKKSGRKNLPLFYYLNGEVTSPVFHPSIRKLALILLNKSFILTGLVT